MRAIETRYAGPTNTRGARIIVTAGDVRKVYSLGELEDAAITIKMHMNMSGEWAHTIAANEFVKAMKWDSPGIKLVP